MLILGMLLCVRLGPVLGLNRKVIGPSIKNNLVKIPPGLYGQPTETQGLYGQPTETSIILEGIETGALLDTGSAVSTIRYLYSLQYIQSMVVDFLQHIQCPKFL
jgi:hypothetical protein